MVLQSPIYKAPSISKMGKKSSPLNSSSQKIDSAVKGPKLKTSKMSFVKGLGKSFIKPESLKGPDTSEVEGLNSIASTLTETNSILVEIQKQLALDFDNRIAERKERLKNSKRDIRKKKISAKESFVEKGPNLVQPVKELGIKVLSPVKNIFDKILEFLTLVGAGILLNSAWEWLQDEKNRENLSKVLLFLRDHWKTLLGIFIGVKIISALGTIIGFALKLRKLFKLLRGGSATRVPGTGGTSAPRTTPGGGAFRSPSRYRMPGQTAAGSNFALEQARAALTKSGANFPSGAPKGNIFQRLARRGANAAKTGGGSPATTIATFLIGDAAFSAVNSLTDKAGKAFEDKMIQDTVDRINTYDDKKRAEVIKKIEEKLLKELEYQKSPLYAIEKAIQLGGDVVSDLKLRKNYGILSALEGQGMQTVPEDKVDLRVLELTTANTSKEDLIKLYKNDKAREVDKKAAAKILIEKFSVDPQKLSLGGLIPGMASMVDTIPALLARGEFVINSMSTKLFKPFLYAINDNAGRIFKQFTKSIEMMKSNTDLSAELAITQFEVLKKLNDHVEEMVEREREKKRKELEEMGGPLPGARRVSTTSVKTKPQKVPTKIQTYRRGRGGPNMTHDDTNSSGNSKGPIRLEVIPVTNEPIVVPPQQEMEEPPTDIQDNVQVKIKISSTDSSNPYIMNSYVNYGIDV